MRMILPNDIPWNPKEKFEQPEGKLLLIDGRTIDGYPRKGDNPMPANDKLLTDNAFFLLANYEKILSDSRMFLAPIGVVSGLAYVGTSSFARPTLGIYIEWWLTCNAAVLFLKGTQPNLLWHLAGSPLSGCNICSCVDVNGERHTIEVCDFSRAWRTFTSINGRYKQAKDLYEAYSLEEVIDKLKADPDHKSVDHIVAMMMTRQCISLKERLDESQKMYSDLEVEVEIAHAMLHIDEIRPLYDEMMGFIAELEKDIALCQALHRDVKARLHAGEISSKTAQIKITSILAKKEEKRKEISRLRSAFSEKIRSFDPKIILRAVEALFAQQTIDHLKVSVYESIGA